jgi:hypothetical protein
LAFSEIPAENTRLAREGFRQVCARVDFSTPRRGFLPRREPTTMSQVRQTNEQPPQRYTGVVCRRCIQPIATVEERDGTAAITCPACGYTRAAGPALKI